jgi:UDP-N-acetylglucosamine diphosphorylase / glucose-1-phosphate thymidylyltransferase / UDP-N-acetylgalactosamine diphosphorylase / glucosamine-1-phosphate N-acetyltransferase / galactosamine-1-phosphate N-acetyltransferase
VAALSLYLYDDAVARAWQPFALTRPVGELLLGAYTMRERVGHCFGARCAGHITAAHLRGFEEPHAAPVVDPADIAADGPRLFLNSRFVPDWQPAFAAPDRPTVLHCGGDVVGWYAPADSPAPEPDWFAEPAAGAPTGAPTGAAPAAELSGRVLGRVWDLVAENPGQIERDHHALTHDGLALEDVERAGQFHAIGYASGMLQLGTGVIIEPNVVLDFSAGPIWLADGVTVRSFTRLAGPAFVGAHSTLLGGPFTALSIGPRCKVHGEVEESVVLGYSNKAHDGFLGHAYLGSWVNLGAMTTNSDLKNNYGTIRIWTPAGDEDTGLIKLGCLLGDHVKTGIGALLNTGTVVGAGSNLWGTELPPKYVPPFSWGSGAELVAYDVDRFLAVAGTVMQRRGLELAPGMREVLRQAWQIGRDTA